MNTVDDVVSVVLQSSKYRTLDKGLVRRLAERELCVHRQCKAAIKETKNALHQAVGAYTTGPLPYRAMLDDLRAARAAGGDALIAACVRCMSRHASTRERLPVLHEFYGAIFAETGPINSILDLACGLNPLCAPVIGLGADVSYRACDVFTDLSAFLNDFFLIAEIGGEADTRDLVSSPPPHSADLALALKILPVLAQSGRDAPLTLLRSLNARYIAVSFPTYSLGGARRGMLRNYESRFLDLVEPESWTVRRIEVPGELCFLIRK